MINELAYKSQTSSCIVSVHAGSRLLVLYFTDSIYWCFLDAVLFKSPEMSSVPQIKRHAFSGSGRHILSLHMLILTAAV